MHSRFLTKRHRHLSLALALLALWAQLLAQQVAELHHARMVVQSTALDAICGAADAATARAPALAEGNPAAPRTPSGAVAGLSCCAAMCTMPLAPAPQASDWPSLAPGGAPPALARAETPRAMSPPAPPARGPPPAGA